MDRKCIFCDEALSDRGAFCKACGNQSACRDCQAILEVGSNFCVVCGANVGTPGNAAPDVVSATKDRLNTFEFTETKTSRSAKAILTDESVANLQDTLSLVVSSYPLGTIPRPSRSLPHATNGQQDLFQNNNGTTGSDDAIDVTPRTLSAVSTATSDRLKGLFYRDGENLVLEVQDLKASGQKDAGIRLIYLRMLYAKEIDGEDFVLREDINATLKEAMGALDPNVVSFITNTNDLSHKEENGKAFLRLKGDGHSKALRVLEEVVNDQIRGTFTLGSRLKAGGKSTSKGDEGKGGSKSSKPASSNKDVETWISKWKALDLKIDLQGIAKDLSQINKVTLALWLIYKATNGTVETAKTTKIAPIINQMFFTSGARQNLDQALKNGYKDILQKTPEGWRITPEGIKLAQKFVDDFSGKGDKPKK